MRFVDVSGGGSLRVDGMRMKGIRLVGQSYGY